MMALLMYILFCYGVAITLSMGEILTPIRNWVKNKTEWGHKLMKCPMCSSFWIGALTSIALWNWPHLIGLPSSMFTGSEMGFDMFRYIIKPVYLGFIASAGSFLLHCVAWRLALRDRDF